ncbi:Integrase, catalytic core protein [Phytophthora megakarya]|uniref:Integrase, catalytic core protein n=1 Tax=Phytophthora megakarya TaxID=4795 RepID=A0A225W8U0_9STRA|nr:Integrase, catalytic core protein [Phytophthora megakarya]
MKLLHQRFGHLGMYSTQLDVGVKINENGLTSYECAACAASKAKRMTYARVPVRRSKPLATLIVDICALNEDSVDRATMFLFIVDKATRYKWVFLLKRKSEAAFYIKGLLNRLQRRFPDQRVRLLWSDQGGEFLGNEHDEYGKERGIELKMANIYSPQENGIVEKSDGDVLPRLRAMLMATNLPLIL